jgi:hypothetical protein
MRHEKGDGVRESGAPYKEKKKKGRKATNLEADCISLRCLSRGAGLLKIQDLQLYKPKKTRSNIAGTKEHIREERSSEPIRICAKKLTGKVEGLPLPFF